MCVRFVFVRRCFLPHSLHTKNERFYRIGKIDAKKMPSFSCCKANVSWANGRSNGGRFFFCLLGIKKHNFVKRISDDRKATKKNLYQLWNPKLYYKKERRKKTNKDGNKNRMNVFWHLFLFCAFLMILSICMR